MKLIPGDNLSVMVFAAGYGKRLKPLTDVTPKPLLLFKGKTCLDFIIQALKKIGFSKIYINAHHLADQIVDFCKNDMDLIPLVENPILETGGGLLNASADGLDYILTLNADIWLSDYTDIARTIDAFNPDLMDELLLLCSKQKTLDYKGQGDYIASHADIIPGISPFLIQHRSNAPSAEYIFSGIQIIKKSHVIKHAPSFETFSLRHYFDQSEKNNTLWGIEAKGMWCDIGTLDVYNKHR